MPEGTIRVLRITRDNILYFKDRYTIWCKFKGWYSCWTHGYYFDHANDVEVK